MAPVVHRGPLNVRFVLAWLCLAPALGGCARLVAQPATVGQSPLKAATASPNSMTLEIVFARFPLGQADLNAPLWDSIDEQHLPAELRSRLAVNGFRAGLVSTHLPQPLAKLLNYTDKAPTEDEQHKVDLPGLQAEPVVRQRRLQLRTSGRGEILASGTLKELPSLLCENGQVCGRTYREAQALFAVQGEFESEGRVRLALTPEIQHGESRQQWNGRDGVFRMEMARPKEIFEALRIEAALTPGQMLVIGCLPERPGSLGSHFFTETTAQGPEQKILLIRLAQMPPAELYLDE